ncbi:MAG: transglutaminase-like domain-containing protein [Syntrophobacterales bacterium]|nr:transglutaminase-like domain-containing protein [Syntrophobacterales bacterium]
MPIEQEPIELYLKPTAIIDSDSPSIMELASNIAGRFSTPKEKAVRIYYWVRDKIIYDPYSPFHRPKDYQASEVLKRGRGFCIPKASLMCALARAQAIPCRLAFADVRNHLATKRFLERLGSDLFVYHGYVELYLDGRWVKASPTFNRELCYRFGVPPLEFDGIHDAVFQAYALPLDEEGSAYRNKGGEPRRFMEYVTFHGSRFDVPIDEIIDAWERVYGRERVKRWIDEVESK